MYKIKIAEPNISAEDIASVVKALKEGQVSGRAPVVEQFEKAFAKRMGVAHAIAVNSGTSALFLALRALGIKQGDEVIVPNHAYIAVANAAAYCGAVPVFVEIGKDGNIDPSAASRAITYRTKAIIAVHTYGLPCRMQDLMELSALYGIPIVEDCAEAHGATYDGKPVGSFGAAAAYSFFANKIMTTGEGGMVATNDEHIANKVRELKDQCASKLRKYWHTDLGFSLHMSALQAALGLSQLSRLDSFIEKKRAIASRYIEALKDIVEVPQEDKRAKSIYWMFRIGTKHAGSLKEYLEERGIETRPCFPPLNLQPIYRTALAMAGESWRYYTEGLCLPSGTTLTSSAQAEVIRAIKDFFKCDTPSSEAQASSVRT